MQRANAVRKSRLVIRAERTHKFVVPSSTDLSKSVAHDTFVTTVMTRPGKVKRLNAGRFGARQVVFGNGVKATLKPKLFSNEDFRGIPKDTQYLREAAAYQLDWKLLHFGIVPPTVLTMYDETPASIQSWVVGLTAAEIEPGLFSKNSDDWKERCARFSAKVDTNALRKLVLFDLIVNNVDRHAKNCLFDPFLKRVWAIDNGMTFGRYYERYNNVFHRYIFKKKLELRQDERERLESITLDQLTDALQRYLPKRDIVQTYWRIRWVLEQSNLGFAAVAPDAEGRDDFPSNKKWFLAQERQAKGNKVLAQLAQMGSQGVVADA